MNRTPTAAASDRNDPQLERIERMLRAIGRRTRQLAEREQRQTHYSVEDFAKVVRKAPFTVRQWCLHARIRATKTNNGRSWVISQAELERYRAEGLLSADPLRL